LKQVKKFRNLSDSPPTPLYLALSGLVREGSFDIKLYPLKIFSLPGT